MSSQVLSFVVLALVVSLLVVVVLQERKGSAQASAVRLPTPAAAGMGMRMAADAGAVVGTPAAAESGIADSAAVAVIDREQKRRRTLSLLVRMIYGSMAGVSTMLANHAGALVSLYLIKEKLTKQYIIGTAAVIFLTFNTTKFFVHIFMWNSIDFNVALLSIGFWPWCLFGSYIGRKLSQRIPEKVYKWGLILFVMLTVGILTVRL